MRNGITQKKPSKTAKGRRAVFYMARIILAHGTQYLFMLSTYFIRFTFKSFRNFFRFLIQISIIAVILLGDPIFANLLVGLLGIILYFALLFQAGVLISKPVRKWNYNFFSMRVFWMDFALAGLVFLFLVLFF